jgi:hypothetical protein
MALATYSVTFSLQSALVPFAVGIVVLVLTGVLLAWDAAARGAYAAPETVMFRRSPTKLVGGAVVIAICAFAAPFVGVDANNGLFLGLLFVAFFALIWYGQFFAPSLAFYVADANGLTRQILGVKKTLPWYTIDWVYPARKTTSYRAYGVVKVGQSTQDNFMVEAGPRRSIKIVVKAWLIGGDPRPLLAAIQQRATSAEFGFDKSPLVIQRRSVGVPAR